ncbi:hypothetical protein A3Q56_01968 [Intoshia linei]|uniref:Uncharacterized protein n=1 Tax=Intoshia linei TaxID=1819745 RepID=A0A177B9I3_9BILA|nr:hypothetical protein A3Q56_01968 [Intoshia linei]
MFSELFKLLCFIHKEFKIYSNYTNPKDFTKLNNEKNKEIMHTYVESIIYKLIQYLKKQTIVNEFTSLIIKHIPESCKMLLTKKFQNLSTDKLKEYSQVVFVIVAELFDSSTNCYIEENKY